MSSPLPAILYIDDDLQNLHAFHSCFQHDFKVFMASSLQQARAILNREVIEVILSDHRSSADPDLSFFEEIRHERLLSLPARIVLTENTDSEILVKAVQHELIYAYVSKPWSQEELKVIMEKGKTHYENGRAYLETAEALQKCKQIELENRSLSQKFQTAQARAAFLNQNLFTNANYARQVQEALLAGEKQLQQFFPQSFVLDLPKSVASGDFLWVAQVNGKTVVALADCTGHDITGAFMTLIGNDLLNRIVKEAEVTSPELILHELNLGLRKKLKQAETENRDGIDLAIITVDKTEESITFAGAKAHALVIKNEHLLYLKGDRHPAGGLQKDGELIYGQQRISTKGVSAIYVFSDGFQRQPGGPHCQKFMPKAFRQLLFSLSALPPEQQKERLQAAFQQWLANSGCSHANQTDDVTVAGIIM